MLASAIYREFWPFQRQFSDVKTIHHSAQLDGVDCLLLWGGEDISPAVYGHHRPPMGHSGPERLSVRDQTEVSLATEAMRLGIPIIGICRGAQLMCGLSGGSLFQHVTGHAGRMHLLERDDGTEIDTNSLHHQMMDLRKVDHKLIAWTAPKLSNIYIDENGPADAPEVEPEIAWIPKAKALCIQGHPEFMDDESNPFVKYCLELVEAYVINRTNG